jgi:hypothetical protein
MSGASELTAGMKIYETKFAHRQDESDALIETNRALGAVLSPGQASAKKKSRAVFPRFYARESLLTSKITTYPNVLHQVNLKLPDDKDPKLKIYISELISDSYE